MKSKGDLLIAFYSIKKCKNIHTLYRCDYCDYNFQFLYIFKNTSKYTNNQKTLIYQCFSAIIKYTKKMYIL